MCSGLVPKTRTGGWGQVLYSLWQLSVIQHNTGSETIALYMHNCIQYTYVHNHSIARMNFSLELNINFAALKQSKHFKEN